MVFIHRAFPAVQFGCWYVRYGVLVVVTPNTRAHTTLSYNEVVSPWTRDWLMQSAHITSGYCIICHNASVPKPVHRPVIHRSSVPANHAEFNLEIRCFWIFKVWINCWLVILLFVCLLQYQHFWTISASLAIFSYSFWRFVCYTLYIRDIVRTFHGNTNQPLLKYDPFITRLIKLGDSDHHLPNI